MEREEGGKKGNMKDRERINRTFANKPINILLWTNSLAPVFVLLQIQSAKADNNESVALLLFKKIVHSFKCHFYKLPLDIPMKINNETYHLAQSPLVPTVH
jgi:hypothetical protein